MSPEILYSVCKCVFRYNKILFGDKSYSTIETSCHDFEFSKFSVSETAEAAFKTAIYQ